MDEPIHVTKFRYHFFISQNIFLKIWKILRDTIEYVCKLSLSENFANKFKLNWNKIVDKFSIFFQNVYWKKS